MNNIDDKLRNIYENITNKDKIPNNNINTNIVNGIKVGDLIVFNINNMEYKGHVNNIVDNKYLINGNFSNENKSVLVDFDQIIEHYPKNLKFQNKNNDNNIQLIKSENTDIQEKNENIIFFPKTYNKDNIDNIISKTNYKYFIREKNNELHIVKISNGFEIKPFIESTISYLLKNKLIKENLSSMKVIGNNSFCILKNIPFKSSQILKNILMKILK